MTHYAGLPVTTVSRTIADMAASGLSEELVWQAIQEALRRGLTTSDQLRMTSGSRGGRADKLVAQALAAMQFLNPVLQSQNAGKWNPITWAWEAS